MKRRRGQQLRLYCRLHVFSFNKEVLLTGKVGSERMVKISGASTSGVPGGFISMPGATYVGDSKLLGLWIFLDDVAISQVLLKFADKKPVRISFKEFSRVVSFLKDFSRGNSYQFESLAPDSTKISIALLESNRVMLHWEEARIVLLPLDFMLALNVLFAIEKKLEKMIQRRNERKQLLRQGNLLEFLYQWSGFLVYAFLAMVDFGLLVAVFFHSQLVTPLLGLTIFLGVWLFIFQPEWSFRLVPAIKSYLNEELLADISHLKSSQKNVGIVIMLILLLVFYIYFGWEFVSMVISFFKGSQSL
mgnify:CR=1 FL=1